MQVIRNKEKTLIIVILALNIIGALLVIFSPFGGMTVATAYGPRDRFATLGSEYSEPTDNMFIVLIAISFIIVAFLSFKVFKKTPSSHIKIPKSALVISIITVLLAVLGAIVYNAVRAEIDYLDWWLDMGFYAGLIIGLADSFFYGLVLRRK